MGQPPARPAGEPLPPLNPGTMQPAGPDDLTPIFPMGLILQEVSTEPEVEIPRRCARPTSSGARRRFTRARRFERELYTPARIYYKYEGVSPAGSHKPNTAVAQPTRTRRPASASSRRRRAPAVGSSLAFACSLFGLECEVWMVGSSYDQKPNRRSMMETWGANGAPLSQRPDRGRQGPGLTPDGIPGDRDLRGGRGGRPGRELQLRAGLGAQPRAPAPDGDRPGGDDADVGWRATSPTSWSRASAAGRTSAGWRSRSCGRVIHGMSTTRFVAAEPAACPTLTRARTATTRRHGRPDPAHAHVHACHDFVPPPVHAGGLRYHGDAPMLCGCW